MNTLLVMILSYLFGSIPWALVIGKVFYHKDIRLEGSGNLGATNAGRVLGKKAAISVTILDGLKAFISMLIASRLAPQAVLYAGLACCVGTGCVFGCGACCTGAGCGACCTGAG